MKDAILINSLLTPFFEVEVLKLTGRRPGNDSDKTIPSYPSAGSPPDYDKLFMASAYITIGALYLISLILGWGSLPMPSLILLTGLMAAFTLGQRFIPELDAPLLHRLLYLGIQGALIFAIVLVGGGETFLPILYFIVVAQAYLLLPFRDATLLTLFFILALGLDYLIISGPAQALGILLPYSGGFVFFAAVSLMAARQREERERAEGLLAELEEAHRRLREYARRVEELAVAEERNRLAREIHDSLGHYLTTITVQLEAARKLIATQPERAAQAIAKVERLARESLTEVRRSVAALRASPLDTASLGEAIGETVQDLHASGIATTFAIEGEARPLPIQTKAALYRAAQEGLTNVRKHANASAAQVTLTYEPERAVLTISDNGTGRRGGEVEGFGLLGLRERVVLLGGSLEAGDRSEGGFRLRVVVPTERGDDG